MLVIPSGSRHWSMAKEQRHALGHPLRAGVTRTRSNTTTGATLRSAMVGFEWVCYPGRNSTLQQELWTWGEAALLLASTQGYDPIQSWAIEPCSGTQGNGGLLPPLLLSLPPSQRWRNGGEGQSSPLVECECEMRENSGHQTPLWHWQKRAGKPNPWAAGGHGWIRRAPPVRADHELWAWKKTSHAQRANCKKFVKLTVTYWQKRTVVKYFKKKKNSCVCTLSEHYSLENFYFPTFESIMLYVLRFILNLGLSFTALNFINKSCFLLLYLRTLKMYYFLLLK